MKRFAPLACALLLGACSTSTALTASQVNEKAMIEANDLYETDLRLIFYDDPIFGDYQRRFRRILADRRYTDLAANLRYFAALYGEIDGRRVPLETYLAQHPEIGAEQRPDFTSFYTNFYDNIVRQSARVRAALTALARASP